MISRSVLVLVSVLFLSTTVQAEYLVGARVGVMSVAFDDADTDDDPLSAGLMLGYERQLSAGLLAFEVELTRTLSPGSVADQDLEVDSQGVYVSFASSGQVYLKGRLGLMDASLSAGSELSEDEGGETYGLALGYRAAHFRVELDYTSIDDDVAFINLGLVYPF